MTQKITLFSQEVEDFVPELKIDADATFLDLHKLIQEACGYDDRQRHSFLICDDEWRVRTHIRQSDTGNVGIDEDLYLMEDTALGNFLEEEGQRLAYIFDPEGKRFFLMELTENIFGQPQPTPIVSRRHGQAPAQTQTTDEAAPVQETKVETEENFYGDEGFEEGELDMEGFEISGE